MKTEKGIAYCGLACCLCTYNDTCAGCRNEGCTGKEWCKNYNCSRVKGLNGCWECSEFPCKGGMLDKLRVRSFAKFIKENGEEEFMRCLARNEADGIVYHYPGGHVGDYDKYDNEDDIIDMLKYGEHFPACFKDA